MLDLAVATPDVVGERMAGPGIRAWHLARELANVARVTLVARTEGAAQPPVGVTLLERGSREANEAVRDADVLVGQPARGFRPSRRAQRTVYDLFDPLVLELRELYGYHPSARQRIHVAAEWSRLVFALRHGDVVMAATPAQRRFYEQLKAGDGEWLEVPFGVDAEEVRALAETPPLDLGPVPVVVWGGGIWEWLDPGTAVDAVRVLNADGVRCRLLFLGRTRPNRDLVDRRRDTRFTDLLTAGGEFVSANDEWVPYRDRLRWLRAARVAVMLHRPSGEAGCSIRTRLFDAMAAGVPVVATEGGYAADLVATEGLGIVVPPLDGEAVRRAIRRLVEDDVFHATCVLNLERVRPRFDWKVVAGPLVRTIERWS